MDLGLRNEGAARITLGPLPRGGDETRHQRVVSRRVDPGLGLGLGQSHGLRGRSHGEFECGHFEGRGLTVGVERCCATIKYCRF